MLIQETLPQEGEEGPNGEGSGSVGREGRQGHSEEDLSAVLGGREDPHRARGVTGRGEHYFAPSSARVPGFA